MKKLHFAKVAGGLALLAVSSMAMASVVDTKHNLGATNTATSNHTNQTTEICIFCHTPHGGDQSAFAPIWNRALGTTNTNGTASGTSGTVYQRFSSLGRLTFDAKEAPIGSVSAACLSCHDGTQAMDAVINAPGSDSTGNVAGFGTAYDNFNVTSIAGNNGWSQGQAMGDGSFVAADNSWNGSLTGGATRGDMVYLGTDLRNDHPISMQYAGGGISHNTPTATTNDPDFAQAVGALDLTGTGNVSKGYPGGLFGYTPATNNITTRSFASNAGPKNTTSNMTSTTGALVGVNGSGTGAIEHSTSFGQSNKELWWVETDGSGVNTAYNSKDFPLYTRNDVAGGVLAGEPTVECGTCHDPHSGNPTFLRLPGGNIGSQVCLTCHAK